MTVRAALMMTFLVAAGGFPRFPIPGGLAFADTSVPPPPSGDRRPSCVERLEQARDRLAARLPEFRKARVEMSSIEEGDGDPTSHPGWDVVAFWIDEKHLIATVTGHQRPEYTWVTRTRRLSRFARDTLDEAIHDCFALRLH